MNDGGGLPDRKEELNRIVSDYFGKETDKRDREKKMTDMRKRSEKTRRYFVVTGLLAIVFLSVYLVFAVMGQTGAFRGKTYWADGKGSAALDAAGEECLGRMWGMRKAIDRYYADNSAYPDVVEAVHKYLPDRKDSVCPASGDEYIFTEKDGAEAFACPNPEEHGVKGLWGAVKGGPPVIEKK